MKLMEALELRDAMLLEAHALEDDDLLYVVCFRLAVELNHYALIKRRRIGEGKKSEQSAVDTPFKKKKKKK